MSNRIAKVNKLIKEEIGKIIFQEMEFDKNILATVTEVDTSVDLKYTKVLISILPFDRAEEVSEVLEKNIYHLQQILNKRLVMRSVPKIEFKIDRSGENLERIDKLLKED